VADTLEPGLDFGQCGRNTRSPDYDRGSTSVRELCALLASKATGEPGTNPLFRKKRGNDMLPLGLLPVVGALLMAHSTADAQPTRAQPDELASDKGCYLCHRAYPLPRKPDNVIPLAPSWQDIAARYRGQQNAEDRLTEIVLSGSPGYGKDRHWKGKEGEAGMLPNVKEIDEDQARQLVRWILSFAP
jgi:cytochrome c